jgi:hypothetical protein
MLQAKRLGKHFCERGMFRDLVIAFAPWGAAKLVESLNKWNRLAGILATALTLILGVFSFVSSGRDFILFYVNHPILATIGVVGLLALLYQGTVANLGLGPILPSLIGWVSLPRINYSKVGAVLIVLLLFGVVARVGIGHLRSDHGIQKQPEPAPQVFPAAQEKIPMNGSGPGATGGKLQVIGGTGDFAAISATNKTLKTSPGKALRGTVTLRALNLGPSFAVAPLIYTPSWGDPSASWRAINDWIRSGATDQVASLSLAAPENPGVYHIIFVFQWEKGGDHVASGTNYVLGAGRWNEGHNITSLSEGKLAEAQAKGYTTATWLYGNGYSQVYVPADAVTLVVRRQTEVTTSDTR